MSNKRQRKQRANERLKELSDETVEKLAMVGCTYREIAGRFQVGHETIRRKYREAMDRGRAAGKMAIRMKLWETGVSAPSPNTSILLHLAKHELGQHDKILNEMTGRDGEAIEVIETKSDLSKLTIEQLVALREITEKLRG